MSLQVNGNAGAVNWDALLGKLGEVTKTEGADGVAGSTNVTITRTVDGVETPVTIRIPDDLDIPETVDQAAIDSLCQKLAADTSLKGTFEALATSGVTDWVKYPMSLSSPYFGSNWRPSVIAAP